jgi:hypothetical protein
MPENLKLILGNYDDSLSRRSKILDYMLSMYGLELKQRSLRQFLTNEKDSTISHKIIQNKLRYLKYAALMTERSGKGINYLDSQPEINKLSGLELQILLRTGIEPSDRNCIENVLVIEHILLRPSIRNGKMEPDEFFRNSVTVFFPRFRGRYTNDQFQLLVMEIVEQYTPAHVYVNCVWCEQNEWNLIEPVYLKWCKSLLNKKESVDELSSQLVMLIKKMTERRSERAGQ